MEECGCLQNEEGVARMERFMRRNKKIYLRQRKNSESSIWCESRGEMK